MKINRWWFSYKQYRHLKMLKPFHRCEVLVDGKWRMYTEWTTSPDGKCNYDDAILVAESMGKLPLKIDNVEQEQINFKWRYWGY